MTQVIPRLFLLSAMMLMMTACAPSMKLKPLDVEVAADLPEEAALGWLVQMPRDMACCVTPAYPLPCQYSEDGVVTTEWESAFAGRIGNENRRRPWKDFIARPGSASYLQYNVKVIFEGPDYELCSGRVSLETLDGAEMCSAYFTKYLANGGYDRGNTECKTVTKEVEKTLTALKALGVTIVPQKP